MNPGTPQGLITAVDDMVGLNAALAADERPVLVDVTADWCSPCRVLGPHLDAFAYEHTDRVRVISVDADTAAEPMLHYGVYSMPTLMLFDGGTLLLRVSGEPPERLDDVLSALGARDELGLALRTRPGPVPVRSARTLRFPDQRAEGFHWRRIPPSGSLVEAVAFDASGTVEIPIGWHTELTVVSTADADHDEEGAPTGGVGTARDAASLAALPHDAVDELTVLDPDFGDEHLAAVTHLGDLRLLALRSHRVSDEGLRSLAAMDGLRVLEVERGAPGAPLDAALLDFLRRQLPGVVINNHWRHPRLPATLDERRP